MKRSNKRTRKKRTKKSAHFLFHTRAVIACVLLCIVIVCIISFWNLFPQEYVRGDFSSSGNLQEETSTTPVISVLDTAAYDAKLRALAHLSPMIATTTLSTTATSTRTQSAFATTTAHGWPVTAVYPNAGALLPFNRIVAYYGNLYSTQMGVLGQYPTDVMLEKLQGETEKWQAADPTTPVIPALDYITVTAQGSPGTDGKYRLRMPDDQIDSIINAAAQIHGIVFLDIQVGLSDLETELPQYEKYLKMPQVHLAIDPEFSMKYGNRPGTVIGTMDATDINFAAHYLAKLVQENNLPPKILVVHRFTEAMVTNYKNITPLPEVQIVMDMDGWGTSARKMGTYSAFIANEPVQFTGFKLFYKNDVREASTTLMTPAQVLKLTPSPSYIQYQ